MKRILPLLLLICCSSLAFSQTKHPADKGQKICIPVVFHVVKTKKLVSDSLIRDELRRLNSEYSAKNNMSILDASFKHLVGNPNIEFYLLDTMLQASGLKGVARVAKDRDVRPIDFKNCMNVVVDDQDNVTDNGIVYIDDDDIGHPDRALTHESGHWLGLYHIWGPSGGCKSWGRSINDSIDDTPEQKRCTCKCYGTPCPPPDSDLEYDGHKTMYNNWMDYNGCRCMFTIGQCIAMRRTIIEEKPLLFQRSKCN